MRQITKPSIQSEPGPAKKRRGTFLVKLLLSLGLLGVVLYFVDFREFGSILVSLNPWYLLAFAALFYLDRALMAYKWSPLLQALNVRVPFPVLFRIYSVAPLVGMVLSVTIGGDAFRVYSLARYRVSAQTALVSIIVERMIGFVVMLALTAVSLGLAFYLMRDKWVDFGGLSWLLLSLAGLVLILRLLACGAGSQRAMGLRVWLARFPMAGKLRALYTQLWEFRNYRRALAVTSAWTFLEQLVPIAANFLLINALHIDVSLLELVAIVPLIVLTIRMPISFEGIGLQEGLYVGLLALVGVSSAEALLLSAASRVMGVLCPLPWGFHYILTRHQGNLC
jgi:glycosyltransferase 2 family protein